MAVDINGATLTSENSAVSITANSVKGLSFDATYGIAIRSGRPAFHVTGGTGGWTNFSSAAWNTMIFTSVVSNQGSCYSTSNGRFTAPVSGVYWFQYSMYCQKYTATTYNSYNHPHFIVNGSHTARSSSASTPYRLRGRTYYSSSYSFDNNVNEIFRLTAGDYVNMYVYSNSVLRWYPPYAVFSGALIS